MCVHPYIVETKDGLVPVPCGKCFQCLQQWSQDWRFRLKVERKNSVACLFLTLTYDDYHLPVAYNDDACEWQSYLVKKDLQDFFKRVRKNNKDIRFRYFSIGEYGGRYNRCHFHVILFFQCTANLTFNQMFSYLYRCWQNGFIYLKPTNNKQINYVSGYFNKIDKSSHLVRPFKCMSKSLGLSFLTDEMINYLFRSFTPSLPNPFGRGFVRLPRYYRKKLDEWTPEIEPNNEGYKWSDIVRMREYKAKGINKYFDDFCRNYDDAFRLVYRVLLRDLRTGKFTSDFDYLLSSPNRVFSVWYRLQDELVDALACDYRKLDNAKVVHKYTKLNEKAILYGSS